MWRGPWVVYDEEGGLAGCVDTEGQALATCPPGGWYEPDRDEQMGSVSNFFREVLDV